MPATNWAVRNVGPCKIVFDGVDLGMTHGSVKLLRKTNTFKSVADATGDTPRGKFVTGKEVKVQTNLTEISKTTLKKITEGVTENTGTAANSHSEQSAVGTDLVESAKLLILKPMVGETVSANTDWIYLPKASATLDANVEFGPDKQKDWNVEFEGHPVLAADLASGGHLNAVTPAFVAGDLIRYGTQADT